MSNKTRDILCGIVFFTLGALIFSGARAISPIIENEVGSGFVPKFVAAVLMSLSGLLIALALYRKDAATTKVGEDIRGGMSTIMALAAYVLLFDKLGFLISTALYLFAQITILSDEKNRKLPLFGVVSVVTPIIVYFLFVKGFGLMLPSGILPF